MLNLLDWDKPLKVNGRIYPNSQAAWEALKNTKEELEIELNFEIDSPEGVIVDEGADLPEDNQETEEPELKYLFRIPAWLAKKKGCTTELRGDITKESAKAIFVRAYSLFTPTTKCRVCGRVLTNPISIARGIGPVCVEKMFGIHIASEDDEAELDRACMDAEERLFEMWLPKGYIEWEEI